MTVTQAFIDWLEDNDVATFGQDLYLRRLPDSREVPDAVYWLVPSGGFRLGKNRTGETLKQYSYTLNYRAPKAKEVEEKLFELEEMLNCQNCVQLDGYEVVEIEVEVYSSDGDIDEEDRETGLLQINIKTYKTCE